MPTARLALPFPDLTDPADVPADIQALANALDGVVVYGQGNALPAFGTMPQGSFFFLTTTSQIYWNTGAAWVNPLSNIPDDSVTLAKMANDSVGTAELIALAVTTAKLADLAVTTPKLADLAVTFAKIADALKPSAGAGAAAEALRALGLGAGMAAPGTHAAQHALTGGDPLAARSVGASQMGVLPACRVRHSAAQAIATDVSTNLAFDTERFDTDNMHDGGNNGRITFVTPGLYLVGLNVGWAPGSQQGSFQASIRRTLAAGGASIPIAADLRARETGNVNRTSQNVSALWAFEAGDYIEGRVFHTGTGVGSINIDVVDGYSPEMWAIFQSRAV